MKGSVLKRLTFESLKRNKKRSILTVIGIMLSSALICAVTGMASSAYATLFDYETKTGGAWQVMFHNIQKEELKYFTHHADLASCETLYEIGYARMEGSINEDKPYYHLTAMTPDVMAQVPFRLREGRFPENGSEIVIGGHIISNGGVALQVGDTLTLEVGTRVSKDGSLLWQEIPFQAGVEEITETVPHTFTVVGIMRRPSALFELMSAPGYTIATVPDEGIIDEAEEMNRMRVLMNFAHPKKAVEEGQTLLQVLNEEAHQTVHRDLLHYYGVMGDSYLTTLYSLAAVICVIILATSVYVIRNSFLISVQEKTRQYGLLAGIGATAKQIRATVLYEGAILGVAGCAAGLLLGVLVVAVLIRILQYVLAESVIDDLVFHYAIPWQTFVIVIALSAVTVFLSCSLPARQAGKVPPIVAIRGTQEVHQGKKRLRSSRLIRRLFGIGGVIASNNLQRSRRKYRTTVVSLVMSVSLFVALSYFTEEYRRSSNMIYTDYRFNFILDAEQAEVYHDAIERFGLTTYSYSYGKEGRIDLTQYGTKEALQWMEQSGANGSDFPLDVIALDEATFSEYAKETGAAEEYANTAILHNEMELMKEGGGYAVVSCYDRRVGDELSFSLPFTEGGAEKAEDVTVTIAAVTDLQPFGYEGRKGMPILFVPEHFLDGTFVFDASLYGLSIFAEETDALEEELLRLKTSNALYQGASVINLEEAARNERRILFIIELFLYGFITVITLIGVTNIFNTISTNMILRSREFAMLKSVGMTKREFNRMMFLESFLYGGRALLIGLPLGLAGAYLMYRLINESVARVFHPPLKAVVLAVLFVFLIVGITMRFSMKRISRLNIIETIRAEAI